MVPAPIRTRLTVCTGLMLLGTLLPGQLAGIYSINPGAPASQRNFGSLAAAVAALNAQGVGGAVTFLLYDDAGPFTESHPFSTSATSGTWAPENAALTLGQWVGVSSTSRVTFRAAPGEFPVLDATGRSMGVFWNGADFVTLEGLEIRNARFDAISLYSEAAHGPAIGATIRNCRIHGCDGAGVVIYGNTPHPQGTLLENNFFWDLQRAPSGAFATLARFGYVAARRQIGTRLVNNTFYANTGVGSQFTIVGCNPSGQLDTPFSEFSNNVVVKVVRPDRPMLSFPNVGATASQPGALGVPTTQDANCLHDPSGGALATFGWNGALIALTLSDWQTAVSRDLQSFGSDPRLLNPPSGELHLQQASPCRDAGLSQGGSLFDIDGEARMGPPDIGADEFVGLGTAHARILGTGCSSAGATSPWLSTSQSPYRGNLAFSLDVTSAPPSAPAFLFASLGSSEMGTALPGGCVLHLDTTSMAQLERSGLFPLGPTPTTSLGASSFPLPIIDHTNLQGLEGTLQAVILDPGSPQAFAVTNALTIVVN